MKDELSDKEHLDMLNNSKADLFGRKFTFKEYVNIGFDIEEAISMSGLKDYDFSSDKDLQNFIDEQTKKGYMFSTKEELNEINSYLKEFILQHKEYSFDELLNKTVKNIESENEIDFSENWENLIALMQIVERVYNLKSIITESNYYKFEFHNDENIQDKGATKIEALFSCCYQTLKKYWKKDVPTFNNGVEPFGISDFDELEEAFNDEGFKENRTIEFLKTLTESQLVSMYKVTRKDNPNKVKLLDWLETELKNRKSK